MVEHQNCYNCLCTVDAQANCVISPNMTSLILRDGLYRDVEFHCQCMDDNGMTTTGTSWFHDGTLITTTLNDTNLPTDAPSILIILMPFTNTDTGTYTCSPNNTFPTVPPGDNITLYAECEYIYSYVYLLLYLYRQ